MASIWPLIWLGIALVKIVEAISSPSGVSGGSVSFSPVVVSATMLVIVFVVGFCFWHLGRSDPNQIPPRAVWVAVLLLCGPFGFPIYWWVRIRPGASRSAHEAPPA